MRKYALQLKNISKTYKDGDSENTVLNNISINVKPGEFVAIVGPSGSGKSTFLSIAGALLSASSGEIIIGDTNLSEKDKKGLADIRRNQIGFVFQSHQLIPYLKVIDQLKLIPQLSKNKNKKEVNDYANKLLKDFGLEHRLNHPDIILADEPTASLDGKRGREVVTMIKDEIKKYNKAALMVTHDERVLDLVDTIYRIENGNITIEKNF